MKTSAWLTGLATLAVLTSAAPADEVRGPAGIRDGDTLVVDGVPVRLEGIDAPELAADYGAEASAYMRGLLADRTVTCELTGARTYDRWVGVCRVSVGGRMVDVGAALIATGLALDCAEYSGGRYRRFEPAAARDYLVPSRYC